MTEFTMDRLRENLESLKMKNTLEILDNYLERAVAENLNIVDVLDHIFAEEAKSKRKRAYEKQIQMSGFPIKKTLDVKSRARPNTRACMPKRRGRSALSMGVPPLRR